MKNRVVLLKKKNIEKGEEAFRVTERPEYEGKSLATVQVLCFSLDPIMNVWMSGAQTYYPSLKIDDIMHCFGLGRVQETSVQTIEKGDLVFGNLGCSEISYIDQKRLGTLMMIPNELISGFSLQEFVYLINNGLTAFGGIDIMGQLKPDDVVVVSTAAGATGLLIIQLLKYRNIKCIGLTSSKKISVIQEYCWKAVDYKDTKTLKQTLSNSKFKYYFDNVGQWLLDEVIRYIQPAGTISLCGATSNYLNYNDRKGLKNYPAIVSKRLTLKGFNFAMFIPRIHEIFELFRKMKSQNKLRLEIECQPIDKFPQLFTKLMDGDTIGKCIISNRKSPTAKL